MEGASSPTAFMVMPGGPLPRRHYLLAPRPASCLAGCLVYQGLHHRLYLAVNRSVWTHHPFLSGSGSIDYYPVGINHVLIGASPPLHSDTLDQGTWLTLKKDCPSQS